MESGKITESESGERAEWVAREFLFSNSRSTACLVEILSVRLFFRAEWFALLLAAAIRETNKSENNPKNNPITVIIKIVYSFHSAMHQRK